MPLRFSYIATLALAALLALAGCDSGGDDDDEPTDAERFVGLWTAVQVEDSEGDRTAEFDEGVGTLVFAFEQDGTYDFSVTPGDGGGLAIEDETYVVNESAGTVALSGLPALGQVTLGYDFEGDALLELSADENLVSIFNVLAGEALLSGTVTLTLSRQ